MKLNDLQSLKEYLDYFDKLIKADFWKTHPQLHTYYIKICTELIQIDEEEITNFILCMRKVLLIDAKMQMLVQFINYKKEKPEIFDLSEEEIIKIIESSKTSYYRELLGKHNNKQSPWTLICLSDQP